MLTLRDTTLWTIALQGRAADGARVLLYRTRTSARHELVVGHVVAQSFGPGRGEAARLAFEAACNDHESDRLWERAEVVARGEVQP